MVFRAKQAFSPYFACESDECAEVQNLTLHSQVCQETVTSLENIWRVRGFRICQFNAWFSPTLSRERDGEKKQDLRWGRVWYSVSLVHPGRYHFRKSKTDEKDLTTSWERQIFTLCRICIVLNKSCWLTLAVDDSSGRPKLSAWRFSTSSLHGPRD